MSTETFSEEFCRLEKLYPKIMNTIILTQAQCENDFQQLAKVWRAPDVFQYCHLLWFGEIINSPHASWWKFKAKLLKIKYRTKNLQFQFMRYTFMHLAIAKKAWTTS